MILYFAGDLMWASKIKAEAEANGLTARPVRTLDMLEARLAEYAPPHADPVKALVVDLDVSEEQADVPLALIRRAKAAGPGLAIVAFGPHVAVERLRGAKAAGATSVMARGALSARMGSILKALAAGTGVGDQMEE